MQEQNFEKQVRDKMDELSFVPSAPVWDKVEEQISSKKDKRHLLLWLFPFLLVTCLIGWWLMSGNDTPSVNTSVNNNEVVSRPKETNDQPGRNNVNDIDQPSVELNE